MLGLYFNTLNFVSDRLSREEKGAEKGATAVEYGIMVALIAVVIIVAVSAIGGSLGEAFESVCKQLANGDTAKIAKCTT
jgi:pilus assembly protein Flp/PilA